jgi:hypothetical protein
MSVKLVTPIPPHMTAQAKDSKGGKTKCVITASTQTEPIKLSPITPKELEQRRCKAYNYLV